MIKKEKMVNFQRWRSQVYVIRSENFMAFWKIKLSGDTSKSCYYELIVIEANGRGLQSSALETELSGAGQPSGVRVVTTREKGIKDFYVF